MNMISTGAFLTEMDASNKQPTVAEKFAAVWEKKNAKAARAGGVSLMALSLAACGGSSTTTTTDTTTDETTTEVDTTPVAQSFTLTTTVDTITGGAGDDTFIALQTGGTDETLGTADTIDGGAGTDTLNIIHTEDGVVNVPTVSNVEVLSYRNAETQTAARTVDMDNFSGVTSLIIDREVSTFDFSNIALTTGVTISDAKATADSTFTWKATGVTGAADEATVTLAGAAAGADVELAGAIESVTLNVTADSSLADLVLDSGTETLNITAGADLTVATTFTNANVAELSISGAGDVTLTPALDASTITVSAGTATGALDLTAGAVAEATDPSTVDIADVTVTTGSGDDSIDMTNVDTAREMSVAAGAGDDTVTIGTVLVTSGTTIAGDVLAGGDGTDILSVTTAIANAQTAVTTVSGFEELTISNASVTGGVDVANFQAGLNTVNLAAGGVAELTMEAGANTVNIQGPLTGTLALTDTGTATTDSVTVVNEDEAADAFATQAITSAGFETVNLVTTGAGTNNTATAQSIGAVTVTADTGGTATVNVSGTNVANIDGTITANALNFSGLTAQAAGTATADMTGQAFEFVGASGSGTITGSAGDDVLVGDTDESTNITGGAGDDDITGGSAAETISGGAGDDTIAGGGGADTINGDAGDDSITMGGSTESVDGGAGDDTVVAAANLAFGITVVGGAGTDTLSVAAATTAAAGSVVSGFETLTLSTAGTTDLDNFGNNDFTTVTTGALGAQVIQSVASEVITLTGITTGTVTVTMEDATGSSDSAAITLSGDADLTQTLDVIVAGVETLNVTSTDTDDTTANVHTVFLDADSATTLNVSGNTALVIAGGSGDLADITTMNASGLSLAAVTDAGVTYVSAYTQVGGTATITGSNGVDNLTGNSANADVISGGAGADTIVYNGGADTFTGGAGNDVFDIDALGTSAVHVTISDLTVGDVIDIADIDTGTATWNATAVTLGAGATLANYLDAASAGDGSVNSIARYFQFDGDTYIVNDNTAGATFAATDAIIEITGLVDLSDSTLAGTDLTIA